MMKSGFGFTVYTWIGNPPPPSNVGHKSVVFYMIFKKQIMTCAYMTGNQFDAVI